MKRFFYISLFVLCGCLTTGCQAVDIIFNAGALSGVILITALSIIAVYVLAKILGKRRKSIDTEKD